MEWIKTSNGKFLPKQDEYVLVAYPSGEVTMAKIVDINKASRENARTRQDKYPEKLMWCEISSCCYGNELDLEEFNYWSELPIAPHEKLDEPEKS